jgi:hypothetical protein
MSSPNILYQDELKTPGEPVVMVSVFKALQLRAYVILAKYPDLNMFSKPYIEDLKILAKTYFKMEALHYPDVNKKEFPLNLPDWQLNHIIAIINRGIANHPMTQAGKLFNIKAWTVQTYMTDKNDIKALFDIFTQYVFELKQLQHQQLQRKTK